MMANCFGIAAGLTYGDKRALILIQYTGFLYALNAIRGVAVEQKMPMCMMIGLLSKEPDVAPRQSRKFGVKITEPMLDVLGIEQHYIDTDDDIAKIKPAIEKAYATSTPVGDVKEIEALRTPPRGRASDARPRASANAERHAPERSPRADHARQ